MSLIVRSPNSLSTAPGAAAPAGASAKWLWAAIGALGVSVLALGATLVVQQSGRNAAAPQPVAAMTAPGAAADTRTALVDEGSASKVPPAQVQRAQPAINSVANRAPAAPAAPGREDYAQGGGYASPNYSRPVSAQPAQAPVCASCGRVESVQAVQQAAPATGIGAVAGGVLGGVLGNQVGKGSGRTAATVLGAVGGGYVGHTVEQRTRTTTAYQVRVRMDDGSVRTFTRSQPVAEGTSVRVDGRSFRVDQGGDARYGNGQPVRVVNAY
ncbi:MAG: glycine zipper 2TM domain-containing protein [Comamonadaceae bacterium]|nr:MAG: glycine zipper 2TM domain-containing protein [Comamonadaceae bacterium]